MCPSYMATREERYSTRGRARLLFEMLHGGAITDGWRSREVEEALDLCLACKGCRSDCPVHVDMATYKAEFRAHHYAGRLRPRAAYSMGLIHRWSRVAGRVPWLANLMTQTPGLSAAVKWGAGVAPARSMPRYAGQTFVQWFRQRRSPPAGGRRVVLWPDTFNNFFRVPTAIAATEVLEALGYQVVVPLQPVCCGRPLYDWGRLDAAKALWRRTFEVLRPELQAGTPVVGLEPACVSAFRDELPGLFPSDETARRLAASTSFLTEFLDREGVATGDRLAGRRALVQMHCHQHAVLDTGAERRVLDRLGLDHEILASGCCGMAGAFGFEAAKYDVSMAAAERVLLPRIREAPEDALVIANGFSCREQIEQGTGRRTLHISQILAKGFAA
jgi:Fe-S oxidoreductase